MKARLDSFGMPAPRENDGRAWKPILQHFAAAANRHRRGALLVELVICGMILGTLVSAVIPTVVWLARERQSARQRQMALLEIGNLMERLSLLEWDDLTAERAAKVELSEELRTALPAAQLAVTVAADEPRAKHVLIDLRWELGPGRPAPPVRLAAWVYQHDE